MLIFNQKNIMCMTSSTKYTAVMGMVNISTPNSNINGSGPTSLVITGANDGTLIKKIFLKATGTTSLGMIRLYIRKGGVKLIFNEINVAACTQTAVEPSWSTIVLPELLLKSGDELWVSTQNGDMGYNVIAEGVTMVNCECE